MSPPTVDAVPALNFPRDFGSHPEQAIEWWYITGSASSGGRLFGYQLTFFRARVRGNEGLRSAFAAKQLILAHAAVTDLQGQRLWHEQRSARLGMGLSRASEQDTDVGLHPWTLQRDALPNGSRYRARLSSEHFSLLLDFQSTQPLLLQGQQGLSQKGPDARQYSRYYSETQMTVQGEIQLQGQRFPLDPPNQQPHGRAWLDHEWSDQLMASQAQGWDWLGMNLFDGRSLMAFRMRGRDGTPIWDAATWQDNDGRVHSAPQGSTEWRPGARWKSPRTQAEYPVEWQLNCPLGQFRVKAMLADQELDSRSSTGNVYWEGLSELFNAEGVCIGRGYVELTGYSEALRLG
ncbi:carotenoid 1,2-hydratase [Curvibacter sp. HBC28]|uniref:Carotenoid 1,2-hydratase n=1 Tax=Curvibacter microcysteis TaxID=3026419 RepID=A0ABT5MK52_9BURK|nr:carotenoid 1,2-hydratase [Curvibacter sp. HBC28]MDD0816883.1 carotenoid 1,2-hydratase [Curvibacter sp. HBC28]